MKSLKKSWRIILVLMVGFSLLFGLVLVLNRPEDNESALKSGAASNSTKSTELNVKDSSKWTLVFSDEFNGMTLDNNKWVTCYDWQNIHEKGCTNGGNAEQEWYTPDQVAVKDGIATLTAIKQPVVINSPNGPVTYGYQSGMISTGSGFPEGEEKWSARYGYFEARMKIEGGMGVWPAFWLLPVDKSWPPEIDIMELVGDRPAEILQTYHWNNADNKPQKAESVIEGSDYTQGWHTYAVNWQPKRIDWYIDGRLTKTATGDNVPDKPMEIIINLAIGGRLPGNADDTTPFPRTVQVDSVKVYEMKL